MLEDTGRHPLEHDGIFPYNLATARYRNETNEEALRRVWQDEDLEAEASGLAVDHNAVELHRRAILKSIKDKYPKAEYYRQYRARQRAKALGRQAGESTSAVPHPCPDTQGNAAPPVQQDQP